jgi:VWFA-related protein
VLRSSLLPASILFAATAAMHGQSAAPSPAPTAEPRTIRIEAIVTDALGRPLTNLRPEDFTIVENGAAQKVETASFTSKSVAVGPVPPDVPDAAESGPLDEKGAERAARSPGARVIGLYLDEFHVSAGHNSERLRQAATRFVDQHLRPNDIVVVLKPLDSLTEIKFTRDRAALRQAIARFEGCKDDYTPRSAFEAQYLGRAPAAVRTARAQIVMSGLRALIARIGELDAGLSAVVLMSEGFSSDSPRSRERRLPDLGSLVRAAGRSRVLINTFDPGPPLPPVAAAATQPVATSGSNDATTTLDSAARQTGGTAVAGGGDLDAGLTRVSRDLDGYYILTYRSTLPSDGRFHAVQVSTSRRDAHVRSRSGYWAPLPTELRASRTPPTPIVSMRPMRRSPFIQSWFGTTIRPDGTRRAIFTWVPSATASRGRRPARAELVSLKVSTPAGKVLFDGDVAPVQAAVGGVHRVDSAVFEAAPGRLQFDLTILRADGTRLDTGTEDIDIPEVKAGPPLILQPQLFRAASALEFRALSADANAAPLPAREFRRTEHLLMRVPTFDHAGSPVEVSAKLVNPLGATLIELSPSSAPHGTMSQFDLVLARFAPGEYAFELSARSGSGTARQLIRFRITG